MSKNEMMDLAQRAATYVRMYGMPINIQTGTSNDQAEWIVSVILKSGKEMLHEKEG